MAGDLGSERPFFELKDTIISADMPHSSCRLIHSLPQENALNLPLNALGGVWKCILPTKECIYSTEECILLAQRMHSLRAKNGFCWLTCPIFLPEEWHMLAE